MFSPVLSEQVITSTTSVDRDRVRCLISIAVRIEQEYYGTFF